MMPMVMWKRSCSTLATGARQFVVHEALEMILCFEGSYTFSLTPMQKVASASFDGAEMTTVSTLLRRWREALSFEVKRPDDSMTISTPRSGHGMSCGSGDEKTRSSLPSMTTPLAEWPTVLGMVR